jgi:hypothetical protein
LTDFYVQNIIEFDNQFQYQLFIRYQRREFIIGGVVSLGHYNPSFEEFSQKGDFCLRQAGAGMQKIAFLAT